MFEDSRVESNIIGENAIQLYISGDNIKTIGGEKDGITRPSEFLKDMDLHVVRLWDVTSTSQTGTNTLHSTSFSAATSYPYWVAIIQYQNRKCTQHP